jgi:hypothetical protein
MLYANVQRRLERLIQRQRWGAVQLVFDRLMRKETPAADVPAQAAGESVAADAAANVSVSAHAHCDGAPPLSDPIVGLGAPTAEQSTLCGNGNTGADDLAINVVRTLVGGTGSASRCGWRPRRSSTDPYASAHCAEMALRYQFKRCDESAGRGRAGCGQMPPCCTAKRIARYLTGISQEEVLIVHPPNEPLSHTVKKKLVDADSVIAISPQPFELTPAGPETSSTGTPTSLAV